MEKAVAFAETFVTQLADWSSQLGKPFLLEEFGMARDGWTGVSRYEVKAPIANRNEYFNRLFGTVVELSKIDKASGWMFWSYAGQGRPDLENDFIGDPPHEPRGWYSIYDCDESTWEIVRERGSFLSQ